ncbi:MAG: RAD55 family ATPase [Candidatus Heimdallarchaeota archaeon]
MASERITVRLKDLVGSTKSQIYLIIGPPGTGKEAFALQYLVDGLNEKNHGVFLTTDSFPSEIIDKMKHIGADPTTFLSAKQLQFIDVFSYRTGESIKDNGLTVDNIRELTSISVIIKKLIDTNDKLTLVMNTVSTISIYNSEIAILDFIQAQVARLKQKHHSGVIVAQEGMMNEKVTQGIKAIVDGVIEFQAVTNEKGVYQKRLRVEFAPQIKKPGWINLYQ